MQRLRLIPAAATAVLLAGSLLAGGAPASAATASPPTVTSLSPATGATAGGTTVVVHGRHFAHVTSVRFGPIVGRSVHVLSTYRLTVVAPAHAAGAVHLRVVTAAGTSPVSTGDHFLYVAAPRVSSLSPTVGTADGGARVRVRGANFSRVSAVRFGTTAGTALHVVSSSELWVTTPAHGAGTVHTRVSTAYGTSTVTAADGYTFDATPAAVRSLTAADVTASTVTLNWLKSPSPRVTSVAVLRGEGLTPPLSPDSGTLVATLPASTTTYTDTERLANTGYAYSVFAYAEAEQLYSPAASVVAQSLADPRPAAPRALTISPEPQHATGEGPCASYDGWLGSVSWDFVVGAYLVNPDSSTVGLRAQFGLRDLGADGAGPDVDVLTTADAAGWSQRTADGSGANQYVRLSAELLTDGHRYALYAVASDGTTQSASSAQCRFSYDAGHPGQVAVTSTDFPSSGFNKRAGESGTFHLAADEVVPAGASSSGIDYFAYSFGSAAELSGDGGTHLAATGTGIHRTANLTATISTWGTQYLYVVAVDRAGNSSLVYTYSFYVPG